MRAERIPPAHRGDPGLRGPWRDDPSFNQLLNARSAEAAALARSPRPLTCFNSQPLPDIPAKHRAATVWMQIESRAPARQARTGYGSS
jgi:hypothetical protein